MNLTEELDRSFGEGPPLPSPHDLLPPGRRALARRRIAAGVAAAGVVAVAIGTAALVGSQDQPGATDPAGPPAATPRAVDSPSAATTPARPRADKSPEDVWPGIPGMRLVRFVEGSELVAVNDTVDLVRQVAQPDLGPAWAKPGDRSAAAEVVQDGVTYYVLIRGAGQPQTIAVLQADGGPTLKAFLEFARERYLEGGGGLL